MSEVNNFNASNNFPILVMGVTSAPAHIPGHIQSCFLHHLKVAIPSQSQRLEMLTSLSQPYNLSPEVNLSKLAEATAGYVLGDVISLFTQGFNLAVGEAVDYWLVK